MPLCFQYNTSAILCTTDCIWSCTHLPFPIVRRPLSAIVFTPCFAHEGNALFSLNTTVRSSTCSRCQVPVLNAIDSIGNKVATK